MAKKKPARARGPERIDAARFAKLVEELSSLLANPMERVDTLNDLAGNLSEGCLELDSEPPEAGAAEEARRIVEASRREGDAALRRLEKTVRWHIDNRDCLHQTRWPSNGTTTEIYCGASPLIVLRTPTGVSRPPLQGWDDLSPNRDRTCCLWFGTNRKPEAAEADGLATFTSEDDQQLHWGTCAVHVPGSHQIGSIGSAWWWRTLSGTDDRLKLEGTRRQDAARVLADLRGVLGELGPDEQTAVVFIHGYNVTFREASRRAAQIGCDLNLPGVMAFYSWPSRGTIAAYPADEATIEASEPFLTEFLTRIATESGASRVHVIAHSMGNRGLSRAIQRMAARAGAASGRPFANLILAAPDIDARVFQDLAENYPRVAQRTTLYASSKDRALASSRFLHDYHRAGYAPPVTVVPGVDTVEVSGIDLTWLGHGYFSAARAVLQDIHGVLLRGTPPGERFGLRRSGLYWTLAK